MRAHSLPTDPPVTEPCPPAPRPAFPRYCGRPFPRYRFIPGVHPHPTASPLGHSYHPRGSPALEVAPCNPDGWKRCEDYLYGADLYNHGYWWEAHEAWEGIWQVSDKAGVLGRFLQGLIQTAACHLKILKAHHRGFEQLRATSVGHLEFVLGRVPEAAYLGVPLAAFLEEVRSYFSLCRRPADAPPEHVYERYPFLRLDSA
ncbi:MAG: hypothetical protein FLDDKLPJ_02581 [Phycisphaerae bacterium]|nr:hypothetical protein [Phycisphaerae bacterium]